MLALSALTLAVPLAWIAGFLISERLHDQYMLMKAQSPSRTPLHLKGKFYYIVPEAEYVAMRLRK